ncbi:MAG: hypothetical protein NTV69_11765 [Caldilinea sp.]|jgi:hypothetical protein|nr:hypothetical protein [Caldilinea sp.]
MGTNVKALARWAIGRGFRLRFTTRQGQRAQGIVTVAEGKQQPFDYDAVTRVIELPDRCIQIDEYGWEVGPPEAPDRKSDERWGELGGLDERADRP